MKAFYLYLVIFLEGYVVLSTELVAIRQLVPFVGSGTETIAIVIAAVLMPLSLGYYVGGGYKAKYGEGKLVTIRNKLIKNVVSASVIILFGLSYILLEVYFLVFNNLSITHRVAQASIYSFIFLVYPVYLLGQTVPLVSNYFKGSNLSRATGTILTFSTIGSFVGATLSTLVLMSIIGVHNVIIVNMLLLLFVVVILSKQLFSMNNIIMVIIVMLSYAMNGDSMMSSLGVVEDNNYSIIRVEDGDEEGTRLLNINRSNSAKYSEKLEHRFAHVQHIENLYIDPILKESGSTEPKSILIIGAGGFNLGQDDLHNEYTYIDIDPSLKRVAEEYLFERELNPNVKFEAIPARAFLHRTDKKFDLIFLDAYTNVISIPPQLITKEFFEQAKSALKDDGILLFNAIASPVFKTRFSVKLDNTFRQVFPNYNRTVIPKYNAWTGTRELKPVNGVVVESSHANVMYSYHHGRRSKGNYTDDINTYFMDR